MTSVLTTKCSFIFHTEDEGSIPSLVLNPGFKSLVNDKLKPEPIVEDRNQRNRRFAPIIRVSKYPEIIPKLLSHLFSHNVPRSMYHSRVIYIDRNNI